MGKRSTIQVIYDLSDVLEILRAAHNGRKLTKALLRAVVVEDRCLFALSIKRVKILRLADAAQGVAADRDEKFFGLADGGGESR